MLNIGQDYGKGEGKLGTVGEESHSKMKQTPDNSILTLHSLAHQSRLPPSLTFCSRRKSSKGMVCQRILQAVKCMWL